MPCLKKLIAELKANRRESSRQISKQNIRNHREYNHSFDENATSAKIIITCCSQPSNCTAKICRLPTRKHLLPANIPGMLQQTSSNQPGKCTPDLSSELINMKGREDQEDHEHNLGITQIRLISRVPAVLIIMEKYKANFHFYQEFNSEIPETANRTPRMLRTFKIAKGTSSKCSVYMSFLGVSQKLLYSMNPELIFL